MTPLSSSLTRRAALKALGATAGAVAFAPWLSDEGLLAYARIQQTNAPPGLLVLSAAQYATLEALVESILPGDDRSPGAKDARVADYIDLLLSESDDAAKLEWLGGLAELDEEANGRFGAPFARLDPTQTEALLVEISRNEAGPQAPVETFFVMAKHATIHGYYTSEIGIHKELRYKGNQFLGAFVGCQTQDGKDCPHCGQKSSP
ncbi:MAG: gluconate 2-dehydrogenase subunit 3 family protein [Acidobacteria bacterium]|nr:gluconate 2-dehydrogenase subunit 3 family protein [Acidobacteriota bacterium]